MYRPWHDLNGRRRRAKGPSLMASVRCADAVWVCHTIGRCFEARTIRSNTERDVDEGAIPARQLRLIICIRTTYGSEVSGGPMDK
jgi:hypothetical protein